MGMEKISGTVIPTVVDTETVGRWKLKSIFGAVAESKATALMTSERVEGAEGISRDTISEFLCDGIVLLDIVEERGKKIRTIEIWKMRQTNNSLERFEFNIDSNGINFPS